MHILKDLELILNNLFSDMNLATDTENIGIGT